MPIGAVIGGAASLGGAALQSSAAKKAAKTQAKSADRAADLQMQMFETARGDLQPYSIPGRGAIASLAELYGIDPTTGDRTGNPMPQSALDAFTRSPDYEFARREGLRGVEFSNAGKGALRSGNNLRDLTTFSSGLATQNFSNYRGALERLAALGQNAAAGTGSAALQTGAQVGNSMQAAGAANASGTVGSANAWGGALGNIGNYAMLSSLMKPSGSAYGGFGGGNLGYHMIPGFPGS